MPKMKTKKSVAKRFRRTGTGKIVCRAANRRHGFTGKTQDRKRRLRVQVNEVVGGDAKRVGRMAPYL